MYKLLIVWYNYYNSKAKHTKLLIDNRRRTNMGKFVVSEVKTGVKFNLKANNGQVIASSQVYKTFKTCMKGINSIKKNAPIAAIEDQTVEDYATAKNPKWEIYLDKAGEFRFRLKARNGQIICAGEGYKQMSGCKNGIESIIKNAPDAEVVKE